MKKMRCLVIEDEPLSQDVLVKYIAGVSELELTGICGDALSASGLIRNASVDLIFLDINLPVISGIRFLKSLSHPPLVIFTTAYPEFAVEGFDSDAVDYLVKPFSFERFLKAVNKALERGSYLESKTGQVKAPEQENQGFLILHADKKVHKVNYSDILYLEATGDYVKVHTLTATLMVHETFRRMEELLPADLFIRVHKSFIVPLGRISYMEGNRLNIAGTMIPVGLAFREALMKVFRKP
ncbi:MAG: LytTR family DNA-binding domain-containing protein [Bacteroidetes bacterium]|nr:LytTR family DNA-binding domain-containing protein [Bacteroidota bacterium]